MYTYAHTHVIYRRFKASSKFSRLTFLSNKNVTLKQNSFRDAIGKPYDYIYISININNILTTLH